MSAVRSRCAAKRCACRDLLCCAYGKEASACAALLAPKCSARLRPDASSQHSKPKQRAHASASPLALPHHHPAQLFHDRRRFKVNLASLCAHSQEVITDAELLHLGLPGLRAARLAAAPPPFDPGSGDSGSEEWEEWEEDEEEELGPWPPGQPSPWSPDNRMEVHLVRRLGWGGRWRAGWAVDATR